MREPILFKTEVATCYSCGAWQGRYPLYAADFDKGYQCHKCGGTSVRWRQGRPIGPRSPYWKSTLAEYLELAKWLKDEDWWAEESGAVYAEEPSKAAEA